MKKMRKRKIILIWMTFPILGLVIFLVIVAGAFSVGSNMALGSENRDVRVRCSFGEINFELWDAAFARSGVFVGQDELFIRMADEFNVDPVLFATIAMHETGWGTSRAAILYNNPGGLMGANGLMRFETLEDGMRVMGRTLNNLINERGATTLEELRDIYAPLGADNDPTGLNYHWLPTVKSIANQFGGLTMNCEVSTGELGMPLDEPIVVTSHFGLRRDPTGHGYRMHNGIDFGQPLGMPVRASLDGRVVRIQRSNYGWGNMVLIEHDGIWTLYAHLQDIYVRLYQEVVQGEQIGTVGSTGNSTGPHLHFEVQMEFLGGQVDPAPLLGIYRD